MEEKYKDNLKLTKNILLILIGIASLLRFTNLNIIPNGLNWDEASYGFNAYSILQTGRDEWGVAFPLFLKSFGDFKPALLSYIQIPFIYLMGLERISLRIPVVILSIISILSFKKIIDKLLVLSNFKTSSLHSLIGTFLLATSPWHIHYSRAAMDPMVSFSFLMSGYALYISKYQKKQWFGVLLLFLSAYTYNSARLFAPMLILLHTFCFEKKIISRPINFLSGRLLQLCLLLILSGSLLVASVTTDIGSRAQSVLIFSSPKIQNSVNESLYVSTLLDIPFKRVFSNKLIPAMYAFTENYFSHLDFTYLFFNRHLSPRHGFSHHGNLLLVLLPFLIIGLLKSQQKNHTIFFFLWILLSILPSSLSDDIPHSGRTLILIPPLIFFATQGIVITSTLVDTYLPKKFTKKNLGVLAIILSLVLNSTLYFVDLYRFFPEESYLSWQGQTKIISEYINESENQNFSSIMVSKNIFDSDIFYAFYTKINPETLQETRKMEHDSLNMVKLVQDEYCDLQNPDTLVISEKQYTFSDFDETLQKNINSPLYSGILNEENRIDKKKPLAYVYNTSSLSEKAKNVVKNNCIK